MKQLFILAIALMMTVAAQAKVEKTNGIVTMHKIRISNQKKAYKRKYVSTISYLKG